MLDRRPASIALRQLAPAPVGRGSSSERRERLVRNLTAWLGAALIAGQAMAAGSPGGTSYVCSEAGGKRRIQDRPFADCAGEQVQKNADGSTRRVVPRPPTDEERALAEQREREEAAKLKERVVAERNDRALLKRFPDEGAHNRARRDALDDVRRSMNATENRIRNLQSERKTLRNEEEFYPGKPLPPKVRDDIDANEAAQQAQQQLLAGLKAGLARINDRYTAELVHLRELWKAASR